MREVNMKTTIKIFIVIFSLSLQIFSQQYLEKQFKGYTDPDELITLSPNLTFNQAVELLSKVSETTTGKKIVSTVESTDPIGLDVVNMPYDRALILLTQMAGLAYEEKEDVIVIKRKNEVVEQHSLENYAKVDSREVKISAVFFEMDVNEAKQRGIDWKFLLSRKNLDIGGKIGIDESQMQQGQQQVQTPEFELTTDAKWDFGGFFGRATAMFKFFENEQIGEILASPNITVRDGQKGRIQVGSDFSIKQRDFAGNIIENFFSTGSIIEVTPFVYNEEGLDYVLLDLDVERSSFIPDVQTTEIRKTAANTQVLMFNGEETIIGGLFINEEVKVRSGIPFLKDLPWWVFGIRYLTGSDETRVNKKELVILIKAELVPVLKDRVTSVKSTSPIKDEVYRLRDDIRYYQFNENK
jgi:type IV pilus assembly protein PilQ